MDKYETIGSHSWDAGWEGHQRAQLLRWANLSFRNKLEWLEEAQEMMSTLARIHATPRKIDRENGATH